MNFYTALILNIVLTAIPVFLSIWLNSKKHGFFYAIVFTLLTALIICHFPLALYYYLKRFNTAIFLIPHIENFCMDLFMIFLFPVVLGAMFPFLHIVPFLLSGVLIKTKADELGKGKIILFVILNAVYFPIAYAALMSASVMR